MKINQFRSRLCVPKFFSHLLAKLHAPQYVLGILVFFVSFIEVGVWGGGTQYSRQGALAQKKFLLFLLVNYL